MITRLMGCSALTLLLCFSILYAGVAAKKHSARKEDVKYLKCAVCEELSKQLPVLVSKKRNSSPKKLQEFQIIEITENICNPKRSVSEWMFFLDIVQEGDALKLVPQEGEGECHSKCKTIERTCREVMGDYDTEVSVFLLRNPDATAEELSSFFCKELSEACSEETPPVPMDRDPGEPFLLKSPESAEAARSMRAMNDLPPNAPRDRLTNMGSHDDDDDDDIKDDEDDEPASDTNNDATDDTNNDATAAADENNEEGGESDDDSVEDGEEEEEEEYEEEDEEIEEEDEPEAKTGILNFVSGGFRNLYDRVVGGGVPSDSVEKEL